MDPFWNKLGKFNAKKQNDNFILSGKKTFVIDGASSDLIIVLARTSGSRGDSTGLTLFVVNADQDGINKIKLLTNNPSKITAFEDSGIKVVKRLPILSKETKENKLYIKTKKDKSGHFFW